ncbi:uncharacterized protein LOC144363184 [Saccoglossus kowalevskii]
MEPSVVSIRRTKRETPQRGQNGRTFSDDDYIQLGEQLQQVLSLIDSATIFEKQTLHSKGDRHQFFLTEEEANDSNPSVSDGQTQEEKQLEVFDPVKAAAQKPQRLPWKQKKDYRRERAQMHEKHRQTMLRLVEELNWKMITIESKWEDFLSDDSEDFLSGMKTAIQSKRRMILGKRVEAVWEVTRCRDKLQKMRDRRSLSLKKFESIYNDIYGLRDGLKAELVRLRKDLSKHVGYNKIMKEMDGWTKLIKYSKRNRRAIVVHGQIRDEVPGNKGKCGGILSVVAFSIENGNKILQQISNVWSLSAFFPRQLKSERITEEVDGQLVDVRKMSRPSDATSERGDSVSQTELLAVTNMNRSGGFMSIKDSGVYLFVPIQNNFQESKREIFVALDTDSQNVASSGTIGKGHITVSPIVRIGPIGISFSELVIVTLPHCLSDPSKWKMCIAMKNDSVTGEQSKWQLMSIDEVQLVVRNHDAVAFVGKAGSYKLVAEPALSGGHSHKSVCLGTFYSPKERTHDAGYSDFRLHVWNNTPANTKVVQFLEHQQFEGVMAQSGSIMLYAKGSDISATVTGTSIDWDVCEDSRNLRFALSKVWPMTDTAGYYQRFEMRNTLENGEMGDRRVYMVANQEKTPLAATPMLLKHQESPNAENNTKPPEKDSREKIVHFLQSRPQVCFKRELIHVIPEKKFHELCNSLDVNKDNVRAAIPPDWRGVALGYHLDLLNIVSWIESRSDQSPTSVILNYIISEGFIAEKPTLEIRDDILDIFNLVHANEAANVMEELTVLSGDNVDTVAGILKDVWETVKENLCVTAEVDEKKADVETTETEIDSEAEDEEKPEDDASTSAAKNVLRTWMTQKSAKNERPALVDLLKAVEKINTSLKETIEKELEIV